ncbi:antigen 5 like allergen Cul n 1 [Stomoxys calcitrans]|uniref:Venom allergen-1 n=1 Tax=Stomoxys calcitrans TaxID=35570 RepID=A0A1I8P1D1_STOCA|nr:antigen 5 like allergen Cul n 1 [Stomoxys calcitrans]
METFKGFLFTAFVIALAHTEDYCDKKLCPVGTHIGCRHDGKFSPSCPKDVSLVKIDKSLKDYIVNGFNEKRNFIAGGGNHIHKSACRMATMQWDYELAKLAELNVRQCEMKQEACHNTMAYPMSGQNLAWKTYSNEPDYPALVESVVQMWYDEVNHSKMEYIEKYPDHDTGAVIAHFTAMVADRNFRLGCAASTYSMAGETYMAFLMACNFAFTNKIGEPIYTDCTTPAEKCTTGKNPKYPNLCSISEEYDVS